LYCLEVGAVDAYVRRSEIVKWHVYMYSTVYVCVCVCVCVCIYTYIYIIHFKMYINKSHFTRNTSLNVSTYSTNFKTSHDF